MGSVRVVNADPKVGGLPTYGWTTGLQIGPDGQLTRGSGPLKNLAKGAEYPLISAAGALKQLNTPTAGAGGAGTGGCATMKPLTGGPAGASPSASCAPSSKSAAPQRVTVRHAELGLAVRLSGGRQILVPSWLFETRPTGAAQPGTVTATAVDGRYLAQPGPSGGGNSPGGSGQSPTAYRADGRSLTLSITGRLCGKYAVRTTEDDKTVRVTIGAQHRKPGTVCPDIIGAMTQKVELGRPLGGRQVLDAATGDRVPQM